MLKNFKEITEPLYNNVKIEYNFHTHNYLCGHALGEVKDYVKVAIENGLKEIGISDHGYIGIFKDKHYIDLDDIDNLYLPQFEEASILYKDKIIIKKGLEIEYAYGFDDYYKELLKRLDYLILGQHCYIYDNQIQVVFDTNKDEARSIDHYKTIIEGLKTGYFKIWAHPDVEVSMYYGKCPKSVLAMLEEAIKVAIANNVILEVNANRFRNDMAYPTDEYLELLKKYNARVVVGSDCHKPNKLYDEAFRRVYSYAKAYGLNIVDLKDIDI